MSKKLYSNKYPRLNQEKKVGYTEDKYYTKYLETARYMYPKNCTVINFPCLYQEKKVGYTEDKYYKKRLETVQ